MPLIKKLLLNRYFVMLLWFGLSFIAGLKQLMMHSINNYYIYKQTFFNLVSQRNLYIPYPAHYFDTNHYGVIFGLVIAPFALMPDSVGVILWVMFNAFVLYKAVTFLPIDQQKQTIILLLCAHELMTASFNVEINPITAALIVLSFMLIKNEKDFWAALMIMIGTFIKLYGIVGLAFFFFSGHKIKFIASLAFWALVLFLTPMLFSSPGFVVRSYYDWYISLSAKDTQNTLSTMQDISISGMLRRVFNIHFSNLFLLLPGILLFLSSYIRYRNFDKTGFQLLIVASTLIFPVIFSSSSESPTYIIAFVGVAIWFVNLKGFPNPLEIFLITFAIIVTSLAPSDLLPKILRDFIRDYGLKALPCLLIWIKIIYETWTRNFETGPAYQLAAT